MSDSITAQIDGGIPLVGTVRVSGSRALALKLIYASILSGEECVLANVPNVKYVLDDLELAQSVGVKASWSGNTLTINASELKDFTLTGELASEVATTSFLVPALVHKFGKAVLPKSPRILQYAKIWQAFGMEVLQDGEVFYVNVAKLTGGEVVLPYKSRVLTDMAIITAMFILGESTILNPSTDVETDDLIDFCTKLGGEVARQEDGSISVKGCGVFKGVNYILPYDREEAAFFIVATLLTNGNITLLDLGRERLLPLVNWLSKIGANYEFVGTDMRVWHNSGTLFEPFDLTIAPHPGFITDFAPFACLLGCFASGDSKIIEHVLATNLDYLKDLNRLGAKITTERVGESLHINITGGQKLKPGKLAIYNLNHALLALLYGLVVEGEENQLANFNLIQDGFEDIRERLTSLGAYIVTNRL